VEVGVIHPALSNWGPNIDIRLVLALKAKDFENIR
jgi:hypothetical protein